MAQNTENRAKMPETEHLAMEMIRSEREKHKAKDVGIICLTVAVIVIAIGLSIINYRNDVDWREMLSHYDYISQEG